MLVMQLAASSRWAVPLPAEGNLLERVLDVLAGKQLMKRSHSSKQTMDRADLINARIEKHRDVLEAELNQLTSSVMQLEKLLETRPQVFWVSNKGHAVVDPQS